MNWVLWATISVLYLKAFNKRWIEPQSWWKGKWSWSWIKEHGSRLYAGWWWWVSVQNSLINKCKRVDGNWSEIPSQGFLLYWEELEMVTVSKLCPAWASSSMLIKKQVRGRRRYVVGADKEKWRVFLLCWLLHSYAATQVFVQSSSYCWAAEDKNTSFLVRPTKTLISWHWEPNPKELTSKDFQVKAGL